MTPGPKSEDGASPPAEPITDAGAQPGGGPPPTVGPYVVDGPLGRGGSATVFRVHDPQEGRPLALKLLHPVGDDATVRNRFRREFRALQRLSHPNVLRVESWGIHQGRAWFTMELVVGHDLREEMEAWSDLSPDARFARVRDVLLQLTRALAYIHERGLVHRDVSPGNVMIGTDGVVKLTDFGLVTDPRGELTSTGTILGTPAHLSPEQLQGRVLDGRADLYALGTILYQMLTGRRPLVAQTVQGWIDKHLNERPRAPRELDPLVPELLDRVCVRLLEKDRDDRFASASHLLQVLGDTEPSSEPDRWPPRLVGRTAAKAWLREVLDDVAGGREGGAMLVTGGSGSGKSRLLDLAAQSGRRLGLKVARGSGRALDRAFGAFQPIYEALKGSNPPEVLRTVFSGSNLEGTSERYPVIAALRELVVQAAPCVILVDQLERADSATRELVEYLVRNTLELANVPVVFVFAWELEGDDATRPLGGLDRLRREHLGLLTLAEVEEMVLSVLPPGEGSAALASRLHAETSGAPAYLADMLHGLVDAGVLQRVREKWELTIPPEQISRSSLPLPDKLRRTLAARILPLSDTARAVGRVVAATRGALDLDTLLDAAPLAEDDVVRALDELIDAGIVTEQRQGDEERVELSHARFRDVLLEGMDPAARRELHLALATALESRLSLARTPAFDVVAWHFERAAVPAQAFRYLIRAAESRLTRTAYDEALVLAERALDLAEAARAAAPEDDTDSALAEVLLTQTRALYHLGRWEEALRQGREAVAMAERAADPALLARAKTRLGYILRTHGDLEAARATLDAALAHAHAAGDPALLPRPMYHLGALAFRMGDVDTAARHYEEARQVGERTGEHRAEAMAHNGLGLVHQAQGHLAEARRELELAADLFRDVGMRDYLTYARVNLIELYVPAGMFRRAGTLVEQVLAQGRELAHPQGVALGLVWHARLQRVYGRPDLARRGASEALRLAEEIGSPREQAVALEVICRSLLDEGRAVDALPRLDALREVRARAGAHDPTEPSRRLEARVRAAAGQLTEAAALLAQAPSRASLHIRVSTELDAAEVELALGRTAQALERLAAVRAEAEEHGLKWLMLQALQRLSTVSAPPDAQAHAQRARAVARGLAANLARDDAEAFLARGWGADSEG